jgi:asparagine synthase (glutamine-hydrolysing)
LSIIDLETGKQPLSNENNTMHIVFNGEMYNYREVRQELIDKGHSFKTSSDTEVVLHLFEEYGMGCLDHLNGMFAFAIWDAVKKVLFCARDRLGIKPFYYALDEKKFIFASELKALLVEKELRCEIDFQALSQFLTFEFVPFPRTLIKTIKKLPPGHYLLADGSGVKIQKYWNVEEIDEKRRTEEEAIEELSALLNDAVRLRLRSDVPFGAFLSGGIDSSSIVAHMSGLLTDRVKTFSIGFDDASYNELSYAGQIAGRFNTEHTKHVLRPDAIDLIGRLIHFMDDPIGDFSIFPTYLVSKMAREKVKVVLSGDGGDELFGGYDTYVAQKLYRYYTKAPSFIKKRVFPAISEVIPPTRKKKGMINKTKRFIEGALMPEHYDHYRWMMFLKPSEDNGIFQREVAGAVNFDDTYSFINHYLGESRLNGINRSMYLDIKSYLVDNILVKVDRMSMAVSLEARVPFLDYRIVEFALSLPEELKIRNFKTKYILKKMASRFLPHNVIHKPKQGFSIPMKQWLKGPIKNMMTDMLSHERLKRQGIFNAAYIEKMMKDHLDNRMNNSHQIWSMMLFQLWMDRFLSGAKGS